MKRYIQTHAHTHLPITYLLLLYALQDEVYSWSEEQPSINRTVKCDNNWWIKCLQSLYNIYMIRVELYSTGSCKQSDEDCVRLMKWNEKPTNLYHWKYDLFLHCSVLNIILQYRVWIPEEKRESKLAMLVLYWKS